MLISLTFLCHILSLHAISIDPDKQKRLNNFSCDLGFHCSSMSRHDEYGTVTNLHGIGYSTLPLLKCFFSIMKLIAEKVLFR